MRVLLVVALVAGTGCSLLLGIDGVNVANDAPPGAADASQDASPDGPDAPMAVGYTVYAHSDHVLYSINLQHVTLRTVGPFDAPVVGPQEDVITDLAVAPDDTIYVISKTELYTASPVDGHVTAVGSVAACGAQTVALTMTPDGKLWAGDFKGAICQIDLSVSPPTVSAPVMMQGGLALSGDFVGIADGTVFGTAYLLSDGPTSGSNLSNLLVTVDVQTGAVTQVGTGSGFPKLFGAGYAGGTVFGFTHDGTGRVVTIDPATGIGTVYASFTDPGTGLPISFAGAGVSPRVLRD